MKNNNESILNTINAVEGFNPLDYARELQNDRGETDLYLDVKFRILWFRLMYPNGKISKKLLKCDSSFAVVEARVYADRNDPEDAYLANGFGQRYFDGNSQYGTRNVETAETGAVGRALSNAGFGIQFAGVGEDKDPNPVYSGMSASLAQPPKQEAMEEIHVAPSDEVDEQDLPFLDDVQEEQQTINDVVPEAPKAPVASAEPAKQKEPASKPAAKPQAAPAPSYTTDTPVEDIMKVMTLEDAKNFEIPIGVKKGKTIAEVAIEAPKDLDWYINKYNGKNNMLKAAAKIVVDAAKAS